MTVQVEQRPTAVRDASALVLSAFDRGPVQYVPNLARELERLGYYRYWMSEHRTPPVSPAPVILAAIAAAVTTTLRVGTAGVKLRYVSATRIVEELTLLEALFPARIDFGVISAPESDAELDALLLDGRVREKGHFQDAFKEVLGRICSGNPKVQSRADLWICGLHDATAEMAARSGVGFAYHRYLARCAHQSNGPDLADRYRAEFQRHQWRDEPGVAVVCFGACADSSDEAEMFWRRVVGRASNGIGPDFIGTPENCAEQLTDIAHSFDTTEIVAHCVSPTYAAQVRQYELLMAAVRASTQSGREGSHTGRMC